jgi:hypothetical protein
MSDGVSYCFDIDAKNCLFIVVDVKVAMLGSLK